MCEVNRNNFSALFPHLLRSIASADVIALDFEFSGIDLVPGTLFDDAPVRYAKCRSSVQRTTLLQVGLATFSAWPEGPRPNSYRVRAFNFMLCPPAYPPLGCSFVCQSSALSFLRAHNFDLNACIERGISFLNDLEIENLRRHLCGLERCDFLRGELERKVRERASEAADWLEGKRANPRIQPIPEVHSVLLELELRFRFQELWTSSEGEQGEITLRRVTPDERAELEAKERELSLGSSKHAFLLDMMGFTRIVRTMVNLKKPIVLHNCFTDVLMLFEKFLRPLPADLRAFKEDLHSMLPDIFDTRNIVQGMRKTYPELATLLGDANGLEDIFSALKKEISTNQDLNNSLPPHFEIAEDSSRYASGSFAHEAGFDAMIAGCVLLLLGHRAAFPPTPGRELLRPGQVNFEAYRAALTPFANRLNVIQASFDCLDLCHQEKKGSKPPVLYIRALKGEIDITAIKSLADTFGRNDVRPFSSAAVLLQANSFFAFRAIRRELRAEGGYATETFSALRHRPGVRCALLAGAVTASLASAVAITSLLVESVVRTGLEEIRPM